MPPKQSVTDIVRELEESEQKLQSLKRALEKENAELRKDKDLLEKENADLRNGKEILEKENTDLRNEKDLLEKEMAQDKLAHESTRQALEGQLSNAQQQFAVCQEDLASLRTQKDVISAKLESSETKNKMLVHAVEVTSLESYVFRCSAAAAFKIIPSLHHRMTFVELVKKVYDYVHEKRKTRIALDVSAIATATTAEGSEAADSAVASSYTNPQTPSRQIQNSTCKNNGKGSAGAYAGAEDEDDDDDDPVNDHGDEYMAKDESPTMSASKRKHDMMKSSPGGLSMHVTEDDSEDEALAQSQKRRQFTAINSPKVTSNDGTTAVKTEKTSDACQIW